MRRCFFPRAKRLFRPKCWRLVGNKGYKGKRRVSKKTEAPIAQAENRTENRPNLKPKSPKNDARIFSFRREIFSTPAPKQKYSQTTFYSPKYTEFFRPERKDRIFGRTKSRALGGCKPAQDEHKTNTPREKR